MKRVQGRDVEKIRRQVLTAVKEGTGKRGGDDVKLKGGCRAIIRNNIVVTIKPKLRKPKVKEN